MHTAHAFKSAPAILYKRKFSARVFWRFASLMLALALAPMAAQAQTNYVYVSNQSAAGNTISGFSVDHAGLLTSLGTPFATGGPGAAVSCSGVDRIVVNGTTNLLFVANTGDQTISVMKIAPATGVLTPVAGSPFASGLTLDSCAGISLASTPDGKFLMAGANGQINTFSVAPTTGALSLASSVSGLLTPSVGLKISGNGQFLAASNQNSVSVFTINLDGSLTAVAGSPFAKQSTGLLAGLEFSCNGTLLYGSEGGVTTPTSIADAWSVAPTGALTPLLASPFTATGSDSNVVYLTPDNTVLFQSNQGSKDLNSFTVNADGSLTSIGLFSGTSGVPAGLASDNSGLFLYAADDNFGLAVFNIFPNAIPTLVAQTQTPPPLPITPAGQIQGIAAYPPRSCAQADFSITQTASPNPVVAGSQVTYSITITNHGPTTASVAVNDLLPRTQETFSSCIAGPGGTCDKGAGPNRTITFASLASGQSGTVTLTGATVSTLLNGDTITNTAVVSNASAVDPNPADNSATTSVAVSAPPAGSSPAVANASGSYSGTTNLSTALVRVSDGSPVAGRTVTFALNGVAVGTSVTNASGIATLSNVSLVVAGVPINAGTYLAAPNRGVDVSFAGDAQFAPSTGQATLTVTKAPLTVTAQNASRLFGDPNPAFTYIISGFLNNETVAVVGGAANCTSSANTNTNVGPAPITCAIGTLAATNYSFVFVPATLTINPSPLVLKANDVSRLYGDANPPLTGTVVGLKSGDVATASFSTAAVSTSSVAVYPITGTVIPGGGFLASNYSITSSGNLTITPAPLTATASNATRLYGDPNPAFTGTVTGARNGDQITETFTSTADPSSAVGTYPITAVLTGPIATNYTVTNNSGTLTVTQAPLSVTAANAARFYGDPNPAFTGTITGIKNADNITATYSSTAVATTSVGTAAITPTLVDPTSKLGNYTVTSANGVLTINPAPLSVVAANAARFYGDPNPVFTGTITGIKNGDAITATFSSVADPTSAVGTYQITAVAAGPIANYTVTPTNGTLTINPAPLTVVVANVSRPYGDPNPAFTGTITGIKNLDNITAAFLSAATVDSAVGSYTIAASLADPANKLGNYAVTSTPGTLTVTPLPLVVTGANASRTYGDPNPTFTGTITGLRNVDHITATFSSLADPTSPVGGYPITATFVDPAGKLGNYTVTRNNGTLTVSPAALTVTATNATRVYGDANPAFTGTISGVKNNDAIIATFSTTATAASAVGSYPITGTVDPTNPILANYTVNSVNGTLTITPAALTVTAGNATRAYGDANPAFTSTIVGLKPGDNITATFTTAATLTSPVGSYSVTPVPLDPNSRLGNYTVTLNNGTLSVTPAALTLTPANASRFYGDANPVFTGTITGLKNGDAITANFDSTATSGSLVGTFDIIATPVDPTGKLTNYTVTLVKGVLTVSPAPLTVSAASLSRVYGDPNPTFTGAITGLKNGDVITAAFSTAATALSPVGAYAITSTLSDPGLRLTNYSVITNDGTLTVTAAPLSVSAAGASRVYGDPNPAFTGTISGVRNNDNITATFSSLADPTSPVGAYPIAPTAVDPGGKLGNYSLTSTSGTLTITAAPLAVSANNATRVYGDPNPLLTGTITGIKNGDKITANFSSVDATSPVGAFAIIPVPVDPTSKLGNYAVTITNGTLTITAAPLTVSANNASRIYGDPNPAFSGAITGLKNGDNITATVSGSGADPASPVGSYALVPALVDPAGKAANYNVTVTNGVLTVTPASLSVSAADATRAYGDANPAFSGTITGLKNVDNITATYASVASATSPVGTFTIIPTLVDPTAKLGNYSLTSTNGNLTVAPSALTVTAANATRIYGDANPVFTGSITGLKNSDAITATYSSVAGPASSVGTFAITVALSDPATKLTNYTLTSINGTLTVTPAALTVTGTNAARLYGDANPALTGVISGLKNLDNITATFATTATAASAVGNYPIVPTLADPSSKLGNYAVTPVNGTLAVNPAPLAVAAVDVTRIYGDPNPSFTGTITGLKNGDVITATFASAAGPASAVGPYPIVATFADAAAKLGNYAVASSGTLTVTSAPLTVTAANASRLYGDPNPAFTGTITGLKNGDNITAGFSSAGQTSAIGTYAIVPVLADPGAKLGNYSLTSSNGTLTIGPAPLVLSANDATRAYGSPNPVFSGTLNGVKNSDNITPSFSTVATAASAVGTYPIVAALSDPAAKLGNYSLTSSNGLLTVTRAISAVTLTAQPGASSALLVMAVQSAGPALPTGTVQFFDGGTAVGAAVTIAQASPGAPSIASVVAALAPGPHSITASYSGDGTYTPASAGPVDVVAAPGTPQFAFSGDGGNTSSTIQAGQTATFNISLSSQGFNGTVALSCAGAPAGTNCSINPASVDMTSSSGNVPVVVTVSNTQNARSTPTPFKAPLFVFAGVFVGLASKFGKQRKQLVVAMFAIFVIGGLTACGGRAANTPPPSIRPPTTATIIVTGTSGSQSTSINLNLTISH